MKKEKIKMVSGDTIVYKGVKIYLNRFKEYCVIKEDGEMFEHNSAFKNLRDAKKYINKSLVPIYI